MKTLDSERIQIVPLDFYSFYLEANAKKGNINYSRTWSVNETTYAYIKSLIEAYDDSKYLGIDMNNINTYPMHIFSDIKTTSEKVFFYNIKELTLRFRMQEDLPQMKWIGDEIACFSNKNEKEIEEIVSNDCNRIRHYEYVRIANDIMLEKSDKPYKLVSSGMYSNCYLSLKKLFTEVEDFYYVIFSLSQMVSKYQNIDALVTSSKNGAVLATVLADLLNIKEVHLLGVGPKFSMGLGDSVECIKEGKRYLYIFDFLCTGTELKIVSALVNSKKAELKGAVGVARYSKEFDEVFQTKINDIIEADELNTPYIIAASKKDIIKLERDR
ncbi:MAG: hypothetical protein E7231_18380 [Cellulosilyticum sp.]|nr:hypothetical protein [Cellulosilyticum sp.]